MKNKTIKLPFWNAWENLQPGPGEKPTLHIRGCVFADIFQQPYLKPMKEPLFFELAFKPLKTPPNFPVDLEVPKEVEPYDQKIIGNEKAVFIQIPKRKKPIRVPIKSIS